MRVVVTGAAGFLGARLSSALLLQRGELAVTSLVLADAAWSDAAPPADPRVRRLTLDLRAPGAAAALVDCDLLFHLAAVVSGHAEADFDLGYAVNFDATRAILEEARRRAGTPPLRIVFASTVGVFGGELPSVVGDDAATTPQSSYGTAKAMCELLLNDYTRRGWVDARALRLPTVSVRAGAANRAVTSFASGIVREPLAGKEAVCPVPEEQRLWLSSPRAVVRSLLHAARLPAAALGAARALSLPGVSVCVGDMVRALRHECGEAAAARVRYEPDAAVARLVASFPDNFDTARARRLGFEGDADFNEIIRLYVQEISESQ